MKGSIQVKWSLRVGSLQVGGLRGKNYNTALVVINNDPLLNLAAFSLALYVKNGGQVTGESE